MAGLLYHRGFWIAIAASFIVVVSSSMSHAQLLSPGELSAAHESLEGVTNCTSCHTLGGRGVDQSKCLSCHEPIARRIEAGTGYHASIEDRCETCHRDHLGRDYELVKLDDVNFDHDKTGYLLLGSHSTLACRDCHKPEMIPSPERLASAGVSVSIEKTFLGLSTECAACHRNNDPHKGQFEGNACSDCHEPTRWEEVSFTHDDAGFRLVGLHAKLECERCHRPEPGEPTSATRYRGLPFGQCSTCHADPHQKAYGASCSNCHTERGWSHITETGQRDFDHGATGYELTAPHSKLACTECHQTPERRDTVISITFLTDDPANSFKRIERSRCASCHVDYHEGELTSTEDQDCVVCHAQESWRPSLYGINQHNLTARFRLVGSHEVTPCAACHRQGTKRPKFRFGSISCEDCHKGKNPHGLEFADGDGLTDCDACHIPTTWVEQVFDHSKTGFVLNGHHADVVCSSCHPGQQYRVADAQCASCHRARSPHHDQFDKDCASCHDESGFRPVSERFDHANTRFKLDGAHAKVECSSCHTLSVDESGGEYTVYRDTPTSCRDCHADIN